MFKSRYWREYPLFLQLLLLILMMFSLGSFSFVVINIAIPAITGVQLVDAINITQKSPHNIIDAAILAQAISAAFIFLVPALLFSYMTHPRPRHYLGLRKPGKSIQWLLVILVMISAMPVVLGINSLTRMFNLGATLNEMQQKHETTAAAMLTMTSFVDFVKVFLVMAILPAFSEEMIFRGILMRTFHRRNKRIGISIAISAFIFAIVHYMPYGVFAILFAGVLLGYIYYLTGSLWLSIIAHLLHNGAQITIVYLAGNNSSLKTAVDSDQIPAWMAFVGAIFLGLSLWLLWKNRTPLPDNWSEDFTEAELMQREN